MAETKIKNSREFILSIAATGEGLSASLLKFASKWEDDQKFITDAAVNVSTITNLLQDMARTMDKYGEDPGMEDNVTRMLCEGINADFKELVEALKKADSKAGPGRFVGKPRSRFQAVRNDRGLELIKDTEWNVGMADQSFLHNRPDGTALLKTELEPDRFVDNRLVEARDHLWYLYEGFRFLALRKLEKEGLLQPDDKTELEKLVEQLPTILAEIEYRKRLIQPDNEMLKAVEARQREVQRVNDGPLARRNVDDDARSIRSVNSVASYQFLDVNEVYEAWVIRKFDGEKNWPRRSWSFGWFRAYEYYSNSGYEIEPQAMTIDQINEQRDVARTGKLDSKQTETVESMLATLPPGVQQEIKIIVEDRARASTNPRFTRKWEIVDIIKKTKAQDPVPVWMMLWRGPPAFSEALFILKGETADKNDAVKPLRHEDAFRKPQYRRSYAQEPIVHREYPREVIFERRPDRNLGRARPRRGSIEAGGQVSEIPEPPNLEEAETKMLGILTEAGGRNSDEDERLVSDVVMV